MLRYLPMVWKNCFRNKRRSILTVLSLAVSMCLLGLFIAVYHAFYLSDPTPEQALRLIARNRISLAFPMPQSYRERMKQVPGVRDVVITQWFGGAYKDARDPKNFFARFAVEPEKIFDVYRELRISPEELRAFAHDRTGCVIGRDLATKFKFKMGDRITLKGDIFPVNVELTVRGIFDSPRRSEVLYFNREYLEQSLPERRRGNAGTFGILTESAEAAPRIAKAIDDMFRNSTVQTRTESEQAFTLGFIAMLGDVKMFLLSICAAVMFTILLVSANTMAMSVRERVREVGLLKTLGFTPGGILGIILMEACSLSLAGGLLGFLISTVLAQGVQKSPAGAFVPPLQMLHPGVASACIFTAVAIGLVSALVPAWNASRTPIVEALRSTD